MALPALWLALAGGDRSLPAVQAVRRAYALLVAGCCWGAGVWIYAALGCPALWPLAGVAIVGAGLVIAYAPNGSR